MPIFRPGDLVSDHEVINLCSKSAVSFSHRKRKSVERSLNANQN